MTMTIPIPIELSSLSKSTEATVNKSNRIDLKIQKTPFNTTIKGTNVHISNTI